MNYLISAANSDIAISMARILKHEKKDSNIIGIAPDDVYPAINYFDKVELIPFASDESYFNTLLSYIYKYKIDVFIPVSESELSFFSDNINLISSQLNIKVLINDSYVLKQCLDKYKTYKWLSDNNVSVPETCILKNQYDGDFPVIIKQRKSAGSKNIVIAKTKDLYFSFKKEQEIYNLQNDFVVQKCIGNINSEYTCAIWRYNNIFRHISLKRKLSGGATSEAIVVDNPKINELLFKISNIIKGDFFLNVQLRLEEGIPYVFEINPRFSSTVMMRHKFGFKDFIWSLDWLEKNHTSTYVPPLVNLRAYKVTNELIISIPGINTEESNTALGER